MNYLDLDQVLSTFNWPIHILTVDPDHWVKSTGDIKCNVLWKFWWRWCHRNKLSHRPPSGASIDQMLVIKRIGITLKAIWPFANLPSGHPPPPGLSGHMLPLLVLNLTYCQPDSGCVLTTRIVGDRRPGLLNEETVSVILCRTWAAVKEIFHEICGFIPNSRRPMRTMPVNKLQLR